MRIDWLSKSNPLLVEAAKAKRKFHPALTVLFFMALFVFANLLVALLQKLIFGENVPRWFGNYGQIITIIVYCCFALLVEKRSLRSMGFVKRGALAAYFKGLGLGLIFYGVCTLLMVWMYGATFNGIGPNYLVTYDRPGIMSKALFSFTMPADSDFSGGRMMMFGVVAVFCLLVLIWPKKDKKSCGDRISQLWEPASSGSGHTERRTEH